MLPCTRNCAGKKLTQSHIAQSHHPVAEPLLFLYPRWYQTVVQQARHLQHRQFSICTRNRTRAAARAKEEEAEHPSSTQRSTHETNPLHRTGGGVSAPLCEASSNRLPRISRYIPGPVRRVRSTSPHNDGPDKQSRLERRRALVETFDPSKINGLALAARLFRMSPIAQTTDQDVVHLNTSFLRRLTGTSKENVWKHLDGSGCVIHVKAPSNAGSQTQEVRLTGTQRGREIAIKYLRQLQDLHEAGMDLPDSNDIQQEDMLNYSPYLPVDQIPRPKYWNLKSFYEYVQIITNARKPRGVERILYQQEETYNRKVAQLLVELFSDPELQQYMSSAALGQALEFTCERVDASFTSTRVWSEFRRAGIVPDIACYNLEIKRRLRVGNSKGILRLIGDMERTYVRPDATTWAMLFRFLRNRSEQSKFLTLLSKEDIKPSGASKEIVIQSLLETEFVVSENNVTNVSAFQESMQKTFGDDWLTPAIVESMVKKCTRAQAFRTVSKVLDLAKSLKVTLDNGALHAIARAISKTGHFEEMILLIESQHLNIDLMFRQKLVSVAFEQAWRQQLCNTCRVLWHYAASHGMITHDMMGKIVSKLAQNKYSSKGQESAHCSSMAAIIVDTTTPDPSLLAEMQLHIGPEVRSDLISILSQWVPNDHRRHYQMQLAHFLLERDMTAWQRVKAIKYHKLLAQMKDALALDVMWKEQDYISKFSLPDLATKSIKVELEPIDSGTLSPKPEPDPAPTVPLMDKEPLLEENGRDPAFIYSEATHNIAMQDAAHSIAVGQNSSQTQRFHGLRDSYTPPFASITSATITTTMSTSIPLIDLLLQHLRLGWENS